MDDGLSAKCGCQHCGTHLEFPRTAAGTEINCPHCQGRTILTLPEDYAGSPEPANIEGMAPLGSTDLLVGFTESVPARPVSRLYSVGLVLVTALMVLLPAFYLAMIAAAAWATWWWGTHFGFMLGFGRGSVRGHLFFWMCYLAPLFAGVVLVFFMVKPLFARPAPRAQPLALNPGAEPVLFSFIARICECIGAPMPKRIDLDCQLNAAASFRRGARSLLGNDLVLTIGVPLVAGLNVQQFAGVIAHEFGHFTQGFGLRFSYVIRSVNAWFARLVYERDAWDLMLEEWAQTPEWWSGLTVGFARLAVWFSRQVLTLLMLARHGIGCFMLRQMEYDADACQIRVAGSAAFESTLRRLHILGHLLVKSYKDMRVSWNMNNHLPEDFPAYLLQHDRQLAAQTRTALEDRMGLHPTGLFETHPSDGDRIRHARQANLQSMIHCQEPACGLFARFDIVAKQVSLLHYGDDLQIPLCMARLQPVKDTSPTEPQTTPVVDSIAHTESEIFPGLRLKLKKPGGPVSYRQPGEYA